MRPACLGRLVLGVLLATAGTASLVQAQTITFRAQTSAAAAGPTYRASASAAAAAAVATYRSSQSATTTGGTLTITRPAGVVANDMLIASIGVTPSSATLTPPDASWTLVRRINNAGPTSNSLAVYRKLATASEPASYAWSVGGGSYTVGGIQAFYNVDPATPIDVENGQATPSSTSHATPSVTTTVANAMIVTSHTFASSRTWTPPAGMTESFDRRSGANSATGQAIEGNRVLQAAAGATGAKTATAAASADAGATHILALRSNPATTLTIARPAGVAQNDVLVASIGVTPSTASVPTPADWTLVRRIDNAGPTSNSLLVFYKVAGAAEPASYIWTATGVNFTVGGVQAFYNIDTASPVAIENGQATPSGTAHSTPSVVTTIDNSMVVTSHTFASSRTWTPPTGMTESFDRPSGANNATGQSIEGNRVLQAAAGATGAKTATAAGDADAGATHIMVLRPARTLTLTRPGTVAADDVMIVSVGVTPSTATITPPADWTSIRRIDNAGPTSNSLEVFLRVAGAAEPASYVWRFGGAGYAVGGLQAFYNVNTITPVDVENGQATPSATSHATPSVATTVANAMVVTSHTFASSRTWTPPAGMTESFDRPSGANNATGQAIEGNRVLQAAAGATGAKTATAAGFADAGATHILALRPYVPSVSPGGFNACEVASPRCSPPAANYDRLRTKVAGTGFALDFVALKADGTLEAGFTNNATVSLVASVGVVPSGDIDATTRCPIATPVTNIAVGSVSFAAGRATPSTGVTIPAVAEAYKDVRARIVCDAANCPPSGITRCSTDNFAIRPNALGVAVTDGDWQTAGIVRTLDNTTVPGGTVHKAGRPFTIRATAWNAAATPAVTANYAGAPAASITSHTIPASCLNGGGCAVDITAGSFSASGGTVRTDAASYNEVGAFNLQLVDDTFAEVDNADSSAAEREIRSPSVGVGRFVPDRFSLLAGHAVTPACTTGGSFLTYMNQPFAVGATVEAQNAAGSQTWNYHPADGGYAPATLAWQAENANGGSNLAGRLTLGTGSWSNGQRAISAANAVFGRQSPDNPDGPYDSLQLGLQVADPDGPALAGLDMNATTAADCVVAANCNAKTVGVPMSVRFGRLRLLNAAGSDLLALPVPIRTEYWTGTAFAINAADNCSTLAASNLAMGNWTGNLNACETSVSFFGGLTTMTAGRLDSLRLAPPGATNQGSITLTANLGSAGSGTTCLTTGGATTPVSGANLPWLYGRWDDLANPDSNASTIYDDNPSARATFGIFRDRVLYRRENY
jgi:MSHA biogenesis protein MshQ